VDANCSFQSLRVGDVVKGGTPEIITPVYRKTGDAWNTYVMGWKTDGQLIFNKPVYTRGDCQYQIIQLDVGDILPESGEEIIVANQAPDELILYYWDGTRLLESTHFPIDPYVALTKVYISDSGCGSDSGAEIIACGGYFHPESVGDFFAWRPFASARMNFSQNGIDPEEKKENFGYPMGDSEKLTTKTINPSEYILCR
jgi:hypothetical protein